MEGGEAGCTTVDVGGCSVALEEQPTAGSTTGWCIWEVAYTTVRLLENQEALCRHTGLETLRGKRVLDCSAGTGLVGIAAAVLGASVCMTDVGETQVDLLRRNLALNQELARARGQQLDLAVEELWWGADPPGAARPPFDLVVLCDCLFIAVRDSLQDALLSTLRQVCGPDTVLLIAFEERVVVKERALLEAIEGDFALSWVPRAELDTRDVDGAAGRRRGAAGGADAGEASDSDSDSDGDTGLAALFHQPSPLRVAVGRRLRAP